MAEEEPPSDAEVADQLQQAEQALGDADGAREAGLSDAVVVNRCYYACFHAAQAVLYDRGKAPTSRGGVLSLFGSEVVTTGDATREQGRFLNRLSELRKQADYGYGRIDEDIDELVATTQTFVEDMDSLVNLD